MSKLLKAGSFAGFDPAVGEFSVTGAFGPVFAL
jgi:hypothetical protein